MCGYPLYDMYLSHALSGVQYIQLPSTSGKTKRNGTKKRMKEKKEKKIKNKRKKRNTNEEDHTYGQTDRDGPIA